MTRKRPPILLGALVLGLLFAPGSHAATGDLTQKAGIAGCVSNDGTGGACAAGTALASPESVAISPDGTSAYVASRNSGAVTVFDRDPETGTLNQKSGTAGCVARSGLAGACVTGSGLGSASAVTVSPDGANVYVASYNPGAIAIFDRNEATGALTQHLGTAACISNGAPAPGDVCLEGVALGGAWSVEVAPDGGSVYVASYTSDAVAVFDRDATTGALTQLAATAGCVSDSGSGGTCADGVALGHAKSVAVSPDSESVYIAAFFGSSVAIFDRDTATGALTQKPGTAGCISEDGIGPCAAGVALHHPRSVAISPDGANVYMATFDGAIALFDRDTATGGLTQKPGTAACISDDGTGGACADGHALSLSESVAVSPDGTSAYSVSGFGGDAVAIFDRDPATGNLRQDSGVGGCISETGAGPCRDGTGLVHPFDVTVSPDGDNVYVASAEGFDTGGDAVAIFDRAPTPAVPVPAPAATDSPLQPPKAKSKKCGKKKGNGKRSAVPAKKKKCRSKKK